MAAAWHSISHYWSTITWLLLGYYFVKSEYSQIAPYQCHVAAGKEEGIFFKKKKVKEKMKFSENKEVLVVLTWKTPEDQSVPYIAYFNLCQPRRGSTARAK